MRSDSWDTWRMERMFAKVPMNAYVAQWMQSFKDFPPRQKPEAWTLDLDEVLKKLEGKGSN